MARKYPGSRTRISNLSWLKYAGLVVLALVTAAVVVMALTK